jgi:hypothetical protein
MVVGRTDMRRGMSGPNLTCAESRVVCRQINALVKKSSLHFLRSCCEAADFWRKSSFANENHARTHASMPKVATRRHYTLKSTSHTA